MIKHVVCFKVKDEYKNRLTEAKNKMTNASHIVTMIITYAFLVVMGIVIIFADTTSKTEI